MDVLTKLSRRCSQVCPHLRNTKDVARCAECNVVAYDRYNSNIQDDAFEDILVSSPRYRKLPDSEISNLVERFRIENQQIVTDIKSGKLRTQKEYIDAQLSGTSSGQLGEQSTMTSVEFEDNIELSLEELFPKLPLIPETFPTMHQDVSPQSFLVEELDGLNLASSSSLNKAQIRVYVEPYGTNDYVGIYLDDAVRVSDIQRALGHHNREYANSVIRWAEDDTTDKSKVYPDYDLPVIEGDQLVMALGVNKVCLTSATADVDSD